MEIIRTLEDHIEDELQDARTYAKLAMEYRDTDRETADLFYRLSQEEIGHMNALHKDVVRHIEECRKKNGAVPADVTAVFEYLNKRHVDAAAEITVMQSMYKK